jgi:D-3-phosphoglycerate dehydrogenase
MESASPFRVGFTRDFLTPNGELSFGDIGLNALRKARGVEFEFFPEHLPEIRPEQISRYDAVVSLSPKITLATMSGDGSQLSVLARFGVGYDMVDVAALTDKDVVLTITPDGVRRPVAGSIVTFVLALAHDLFGRDRLVRQDRWADRVSLKTYGLTGRVFGSIGLGNIGREVFRLIKPFDMEFLATDPFVSPSEAERLGVQLVDLETLMRRSDFVAVNTPLMPETKGLIGERELRWMKPTAYFINTSRGPVVDQAALYRALKERRIRGAALDVFEVEPLPAGDPLLGLDNVILTPHSIAWTDQCFRMMGESAVSSALAVLRGDIPQYVVNRAVLEKPGFRAKLAANRRRWQDLGGA